MSGICYWCGKEATSHEHIPPKCLFPEKKDIEHIFNQSFREELITVPSCDLHNSKKSKDDEYLLVCLSTMLGNNDVALIHTYTKVKRTLAHNPEIINRIDDFTIKVGNKDYPISAIKVDNNRLLNSFEGIARGLYYYEYSNVFTGCLNIISKLFYIQNSDDQRSINSNNFVERCIELVKKEQLSWGTAIKGSNPKVFKYQFSPKDGFNSQTLWLNFYEKVDVYVAFGDNDKLDKIDKNTFDFLTGVLFGIDFSSKESTRKDS
jgi:hypothetical protein